MNDENVVEILGHNRGVGQMMLWPPPQHWGGAKAPAVPYAHAHAVTVLTVYIYICLLTYKGQIGNVNILLNKTV